jgi:voltage-gated potassium channel
MSDADGRGTAAGESGGGTDTGTQAAGLSSQLPILRRLPRGLASLTAVPVDYPESASSIVLTVLGLLASLVALTWLLFRQGRRLMRAAPGDESIKLESLVLLVFLVVPLFAFGYFVLQDVDPNQFAEMETKTDALYFATSTIATVGFGDVHATGQIARVLVTIQMAFDLVFVAAAASMLTTQIRERAGRRRDAAAAARDVQTPEVG